MKKILLLVATLVITGCTSNIKPNNTAIGCGTETEDCDSGTPADMSLYEGITGEDHVFVTGTFAEVNQYIEANQTFVVYFGFAECPWCKEAAPVLNDVAKEYNRRVIYVDVRPEGVDLRAEGAEDYEKTLELLKDFVMADQDGKATLYVPAVYFIKDGEVKKHNIGTVETHNPKENPMTEEEVKQLTKIYQEGFEAAKK